MKKTLALTALCICTSISLMGCGSKESKSSGSTVSSKESSTIMENSSKTTEQETQTTDTTESSSAGNTETESTSELPLTNNQTDADIPAEAGSMLQVAHALALCESDTETEYNQNNTEYFWNATSYLIAGYGMQSAAANIDEEGNLSLPSSIVKEFANAIFAGYDGNTAALPAIPENVTAVSYNADTDTYSVGAGGFSSTAVKCYQCLSNGDGTYTLSIQLAVDDTESTELGKWSMTIKPSTYTGSGHPLFNYMITSFEKVG